MHLTSNPIDWYAARAAGIAAYVLLTAVIALGLALAGKAPGRRWRRWPMFAVEDVHRFGGLLVGTFIAIHVVTIGIDSFLPFSLTQLAVPLAAGYRPIWTGLGIAAAELLLALAITNHYRGRHAPPVVAAGALRELRGVGGGHAARDRSGHRPKRAVDARDLHRLDDAGGVAGAVADRGAAGRAGTAAATRACWSSPPCRRP